MAIIMNNVGTTSLLDVSSANTTKVAGRGGTFTGAVVGKHYLVYQTDYGSTGVFGTFDGATIITSNEVQGGSSSTYFRIAVIEATATTIETFKDATGNVNYEDTWFIPLD